MVASVPRAEERNIAFVPLIYMGNLIGPLSCQSSQGAYVIDVTELKFEVSFDLRGC